jgi:hypothetical protein
MSRFASLDLNSPRVRETLAHVKARNIVVEPTLAIMRRLLLNRAGEVEPEGRWWFSHITPHWLNPGNASGAIWHEGVHDVVHDEILDEILGEFEFALKPLN